LTTITFRKDRALQLAQSLDFAKAYDKANPAIKRHFCLAFFSKVAIDDHVTIQKQQWPAPRHHYVQVTKVNWHEPMNIHPITEAILALSLQRRQKSVKSKIVCISQAIRRLFPWYISTVQVRLLCG
jgi:hypothetical protein